LLETDRLKIKALRPYGGGDQFSFTLSTISIRCGSTSNW
jgi:hypothetical protein